MAWRTVEDARRERTLRQKVARAAAEIDVRIRRQHECSPRPADAHVLGDEFLELNSRIEREGVVIRGIDDVRAKVRIGEFREGVRGERGEVRLSCYRSPFDEHEFVRDAGRAQAIVVEP